MEISSLEFSVGQIHPKSSPMVMFTWRNRGLQRVCPALSSESTEFSELNLISLDRKQTNKQTNKPNKKQINNPPPQIF